MADPDPDAAASPLTVPPSRLGRRIAGLVALAVLVGALILVLPGLDDVRSRFANVNAAWLAVIALLQLASCFFYIAAFRGVFAVRSRWRDSYDVGMAEQAVNVLLPVGGIGGVALGAWVMRRDGMPSTDVARRSVAFFVITSAPNFVLVALVGTIIASGLVSQTAPPAVTLIATAGSAAAIALVAALPRLNQRLARRPAPDTTGQGTWSWASVRSGLRRAAATLAGGVEVTAALTRPPNPQALIGAWGYLILDVASMWAAFAAFGDTPPLAVFVFAYLIGQLGGLIPLPGGIGGTDGGLIGAFVLYGASLPEATAAVLAYRVFELGIPAVLGTAAFVRVRRVLLA